MKLQLAWTLILLVFTKLYHRRRQRERRKEGKNGSIYNDTDTLFCTLDIASCCNDNAEVEGDDSSNGLIYFRVCYCPARRMLSLIADKASSIS